MDQQQYIAHHVDSPYHAGIGNLSGHSLHVFGHHAMPRNLAPRSHNFLARRPEVIGPIPRPPAGLMGIYPNLDLSGPNEKVVFSSSNEERRVLSLKTTWVIVEHEPEKA